MFLNGSKSSNVDAKLDTLVGKGLSMAGVEENEAMPKGSAAPDPTTFVGGKLNGLLLFSGTGDVFLNSLGGNAGGAKIGGVEGTTAIFWAGAGDEGSAARGSNSSSCKSSRVKLS